MEGKYHFVVIPETVTRGGGADGGADGRFEPKGPIEHLKPKI